MSLPSVPIIPSYQITSLLHAGHRTLVYRGIRLADQQPVILKLLRDQNPSLPDLLRLRNHYRTAKHLNLAGVIQPLSLDPYGNGSVLVMPDEGYISLSDYRVSHSLNVTEVLTIALQLAEILNGLYQHRIIHKDINSSNILIQPTTHQISLTDFGLASQLPQETQTVQSPNVLDGKLAYLSPEQTGRMNRGIDYRSDFYSLGITLYELLSGQLPFQSDDPLELVYCHLAKQPVPLTQFNIPKVVSDIVLKLMAKNAEDRYQSALGLKADLEICLEQYSTTGTVTAFTLGQVDDLAQFNIPQKLYGREAQVEALLSAFKHISQGSCELVLVRGYSGVGKTALVNELLRQLTHRKGYFTSGKFDQFQRNIPLAAVMQTNQGLIRQLLTESEERLHYWRERFRDHLGVNAQVIIDMLPELELIMGKQSPVPELGTIESANRLILVLDQFSQVFQSPNHPVVIFMDDAQWSDLTSCQSLQGFMQNPANHHWLVIVAYREDEISPTHPFAPTIEVLRQSGVPITELTLEPLALEDVAQWVADTLHSPVEMVWPLANLLVDKTAGNPFFLTQLLKSLHEDGLVWFDASSRQWQWDLAQIHQQEITDNVIELMITNIHKLLEPTQQVLRLAACIGNPFDLQTLATVSQQS